MSPTESSHLVLQMYQKNTSAEGMILSFDLFLHT